MAMCYKILFEVRVFHEYYLTDPDGRNVFDYALQKDRIAFLEERLSRDDGNINEEIEFSIPASAATMFKGNCLKLIPSYSGFKVVIEVGTQTLADGSRTYRPNVALPDNVSIPVLLLKTNNKIDGYSSGRVDDPVSSIFYFSNEAFSGTKVFPFLSNKISEVSSSVAYVQGDLASHGMGDVRAFYKDEIDNAQWIELNGFNFANENDRLLVPLEFYYSIRSSENVTAVDFILKNSDKTTLAEYSFNQVDPIQKVWISVPDKIVQTVPDSTSSSTLIYTLEVIGSNGYSKTLKLIFYKGKENLNDAWALVHLNVKSINSDFNLLDAAGSLPTRRMSDGSYNPSHPVFEIAVRSRRAFWRYINEEKKDFQQNLHVDQLVLNDGKLISKEPRALSFTPVFFKKPDNTSYYLPNPRPHELLRSEGGKIYADVYVSESQDLFPLGP